MRRVVALSVLVAMVGSGVATRADDKRPRGTPTPTPTRVPASTADTLFDEGRALLEQRRYAEACKKFEDSMYAEDALGTRLNLAVCLQEWGRLQSARVAFEDTRKRALSVDQKPFAEAAQDRIATFEAQIPLLVVRPATVLDGMRIVIKREGYPDQVAAPREAVPLDPSGSQTGAPPPTVEVTAPGMQPYVSQPIELALAQRASVDVPALQPVVEDRGVPPAIVAPPESGQSGRKKLGLGLAAGGVGLLGGSLALNYYWRTQQDKGGTSFDDNKDKMRFIGTPLFAGGVALAAVGAYLFFTRGSESPVVVPTSDGAGAGLAVLGGF